MHKSLFLSLFLLSSILVNGTTGMSMQGFAENNIYGYGQDYSNYKKSNHNDYSYEKSFYSKYPTEDKKITCETGQFEGFFVSSVEFCKLKIAQGPPGPVGPSRNTGVAWPSRSLKEHRSPGPVWPLRNTRLTGSNWNS